MGWTVAEEIVQSLASLYPLQKAEEEAIQEVLTKRKKEEKEMEKQYLCEVELYIENNQLYVNYGNNAVSNVAERRMLAKLHDFIEKRLADITEEEKFARKLFSQVEKNKKVYIKEEK